MKGLRLGVGGITDNVYVGRVSKSGMEWLDKQDVTNDFLACVIDKFSGRETTITSSSGERYSVVVALLPKEKKHRKTKAESAHHGLTGE